MGKAVRGAHPVTIRGDNHAICSTGHLPFPYIREGEQLSNDHVGGRGFAFRGETGDVLTRESSVNALPDFDQFRSRKQQGGTELVVHRQMNEIYLDNAATSWPKPEITYHAVEEYMRNCGGTPARGRHPKALEADRILGECRNSLRKLFHAGEEWHIALTSGATESLNLAIKGFLRHGSHVVLTSLEHNSVARPLDSLCRERGISTTIVAADGNGTVDPFQVRKAMRPTTSLVAVTHTSNVLGEIVDIQPIAEIVRHYDARLLVDAAQTSGVIPVDVEAMGADMVAFTGHKSLLGPPGTGGLLFRKELDLAPLHEGGTGTFSLDPVQPVLLPGRYESGSPNMYGIAGLAAGLHYLEGLPKGKISNHKSNLVGQLIEGLRTLPSYRAFGSGDPSRNVGILAFAHESTNSDEIAGHLWETAGIMVRSGHHCAPHLHDQLGTRECGVVRVGMGWSTTHQQIECLLDALRSLA